MVNVIFLLLRITMIWITLSV